MAWNCLVRSASPTEGGTAPQYKTKKRIPTAPPYRGSRRARNRVYEHRITRHGDETLRTQVPTCAS